MLQRHASYAMPIARPENSNSSSSHRCYSCSSSCSSACFSCSSSVCIVLFRTTAILRCAGPVWGGCWRAPCAHALASLSLRSFPRSSSLIISSSMTIYMSTSSHLYTFFIFVSAHCMPASAQPQQAVAHPLQRMIRYNETCFECVYSHCVIHPQWKLKTPSAWMAAKYMFRRMTQNGNVKERT